jgi:hypothetical protein
MIDPSEAWFRNLEIGSGMAPLASTDRIMNALEGMYRMAGTRHQGQILAIVGPSHIGKSTAQKLFMLQKATELGGIAENVKPGENVVREAANVSYVTVTEADGTITHPVVRIQILENPTFKALADNTVRALLRGPPPKISNMDELANLLARQLVGKKVRLVIYDDVQELANVTGAPKNRAVVLLKNLCKVGLVEVAAVGIEGTLQVINSDPQTAKLLTKRVILRPIPCPAWDNDAWASDPFVAFLSEMKPHLPFPADSPIERRDVAEPMWVYSEGLIGVVKALLQAATDFAIHHNLPCIDRQVLRDVLRYEMDLDDTDNPFVNDPSLGVA